MLSNDRCLFLLHSIFEMCTATLYFITLIPATSAGNSHTHIRKISSIVEKMAWHTSLVFLLYCSIVLSQVCDNEQLCDSERTTGFKKCKYFDPAQFNEDSPSIVYGKITYTVHFFACDIYMYIVSVHIFFYR